MFRDIMAPSADEPSEMDAWLIARLQTRIKRLHESMSEYDLRSFVNEVYFEVPQDFRWYIKRGGCDGPTLRHALERWVPLMAPVTPHIAEELWALLGKEGFVSQVQLPEGEVTEEVVKVEARERLVERLVSDVAEILKVTAIKPKRLVLMVAPRWKADMVESALAMPADLMDMAGLIKSSMSKAVDVPGAKKEVPSFAKELVAELSRASEEERRAMSIRLDELAVLTSARGFLEGHFGCSAEVFAGDDPDRYDPKGKARFAKPGRPAIYVE
jgi:leucyl-tRNA synthetase